MRPSALSIAELRARPGTKWHRYPDDVLPAWIAEMDFPVAEPIQAALRQLVDQAAYGYEEKDTRLYPGLAHAFAEYMRRRHGWQVSSEHVVPVADLVQALFALVVAFSSPGEGVLLHMPIYPPFQNAVRDTRRRIVEHPLVDDGTRFVLDAAALPHIFDQDRPPLLLVCNPHNPTGRVFERAELEALASIALERQAVVVADEVHADLVYPRHQHIPFASLGPEIAARTITITSATKAYNIPGLRCGLMHFGSSALRERFRAVFPDRLLGSVHQFGIQATIAAWTDCDAWLDGVLEVLRDNRSRLADFVGAELRGVRHFSPEATFLAWLDSRGLGLDRSPQRFFLEEARVALNDGAEFGAAGRGYVRLNFGTSAAILDELLGRMARALAAAPRAGASVAN